ncbi:hypothetical protein B0J14DRAFT_568927 [Halenospora varia]|nr:hypothetical protein B0J14DRAFT_568927 [Halenospora varia]
MASIEMKHFADSLGQLSHSAIGLLKVTEQKEVANRHRIEELSAVVASKHQIISRQKQVINALRKKYAQLEKDLISAQEELRAMKGVSPTLTARTDSMSSGSVLTTTTEEHVIPSIERSEEKTSDLVNLPSLKDILERINTNYSASLQPRTFSRSPPSPPYSGSQLKGLAISEGGIPHMQPSTPITFSAESPLKRRRVAGWSSDEDRYSRRQKSPKSV